MNFLHIFALKSSTLFAIVSIEFVEPKFIETELFGLQDLDSYIWGKSGKTIGLWIVSGIEGNVDSWKSTFRETKVLRVVKSRTLYPNVWWITKKNTFCCSWMEFVSIVCDCTSKA